MHWSLSRLRNLPVVSRRTCERIERGSVHSSFNIEMSSIRGARLPKGTVIPYRPLPFELLEEIFLCVILSHWRLNQQWKPLGLVNQNWRAVAQRLQFINIKLRDEKHVALLVDLAKKFQIAGDGWSPTVSLQVNMTRKATIPRLHTLLQLFGSSLEYLRIWGNRDDYLLPRPGPYLGLAPLDTINSTGAQPSSTIILPRLRIFFATSMHAFDVLTILVVAGGTLESIRILRSSPHISQVLHISPERLVALPALRFLGLDDFRSVEEEMANPLFTSVAPGLTRLHITVRRSQLQLIAAYLSENAFPSLKSLLVDVAVAQGETDDLGGEVDAACHALGRPGLVVNIEPRTQGRFRVLQ